MRTRIFKDTDKSRHMQTLNIPEYQRWWIKRKRTTRKWLNSSYTKARQQSHWRYSTCSTVCCSARRRSIVSSSISGQSVSRVYQLRRVLSDSGPSTAKIIIGYNTPVYICHVERSRDILRKTPKYRYVNRCLDSRWSLDMTVVWNCLVFI